MSGNNAGNRVERLLRLIPFLQHNAGISIADTARFFAISEERLISDLNLIWLCGLPGYSHLELIDVFYDDDTITIKNAEVVSRPMRITFDEGTTLLLAVENLIAISPESDATILKNVRSKLIRLLNLEFHEQESNYDSAEKMRSELIVPTVLKALENSELALECTYYSATQDTLIHDHIIPNELSTRNGALYLKAFSANEGSHRYFRVDRFKAVVQIDRTQMPHNSPSFQQQRDSADIQVELDIKPEAFWFIQRWRLTSLIFDKEPRAFRGTLQIHNHRWLERAALSSGGALTVISPEELRNAVVSAAEQALANYENPLK